MRKHLTYAQGLQRSIKDGGKLHATPSVFCPVSYHGVHSLQGSHMDLKDRSRLNCCIRAAKRTICCRLWTRRSTSARMDI